MSLSSLCSGWLRHTGYAVFSFALVCILVERVMPGFATPYLHPYALLMGALVLMVFFSPSD